MPCQLVSLFINNFIACFFEIFLLWIKLEVCEYFLDITDYIFHMRVLRGGRVFRHMASYNTNVLKSFGEFLFISRIKHFLKVYDLIYKKLWHALILCE